MPLTPQQLSNLHLIAEASVRCELLTSIPAELTASQCIIESGWLKYAPGNNCFGIKSYSGSFGRQLLKTREWFTDHERDYFLGLNDSRTAELVDPTLPPSPAGRRQYHVFDWFAIFLTLTDCFSRRASMFKTRRYETLQTAYASDRNLESYFRGIGKSGYATDPAYADKLLSIIRMPEVQDAIYEAREALGKSVA